MELTRSQCEQIKTTYRRLTMFSERNWSTEVLQAHKRIDSNLPDNFGDKFLSETRPRCDFPPKAVLVRHQSACPSSQDRRMIILFSDNYHVPDSTD